MKVWIDLISGDEMVSDSYKHVLCFGDAGLEVRASYKTKGVEQIAIASDDVIEDDGSGETVVDIVDAFQLHEIQLTKKDFMAYVKQFLKAVSEKLESIGKGDRIPEFKKGATEMVKYIVGRFDEFQFYTGPKFSMEGGLAFSYQKEQEDEGPTFLFFHDAMKEEKF
jgi:hypothetical protein